MIFEKHECTTARVHVLVFTRVVGKYVPAMDDVRWATDEPIGHIAPMAGDAHSPGPLVTSTHRWTARECGATRAYGRHAFLGTKIVFAQVDSLIDPIEKDLSTSIETKVSALTIGLNDVNNGLPNGEVLLEGIDFDKATIDHIKTKYSEAKKAGKINTEFEKTTKSTLDKAMKDTRGSHLATCFASVAACSVESLPACSVECLPVIP